MKKIKKKKKFEKKEKKNRQKDLGKITGGAGLLIDFGLDKPDIAR